MIKTICGVDVSKPWHDAHIVPQGAIGRFANDAAGIAEMASFCRRHGVDLVVMEATGGYERDAVRLLWEAGLACAVVNPRQVRCYAEAMGLLEKTDRIDAGVIAHFARVRGIEAGAAPRPQSERLKALVARLGQVTSDLTVQKQRRSSARDDAIVESLDEVIALLMRQRRRLEGEIASMIDDDPLWSRLEQAFRSFKGVAGRTVARLMAELPEIGTISNKAVAKLAGLAPIANDSGARNGPRSIRGGRAGTRSILFLVDAIAARYDPHLNAFQQRLQQAGKPKMVIRIALARKLLVILNARARDARTEMANAT